MYLLRSQAFDFSSKTDKIVIIRVKNFYRLRKKPHSKIIYRKENY